MKEVSIVILNWNGRQHLEHFLPALVLHTTHPGTEIVVADNGSEDDSLEFIEKKYPTIRIIELELNHGFSGGYNRAMEQVDARYILLLNSDIEVTEGWLEPMLELMERDETVGACTPKILDFKRRTHFEYAGAAGGYLDRYGYPFCRGRIFDTIETDIGQYDDTREIFWATGACFFIRADLFLSFGGFDSDFFAHMEEIDLCWRMKKDGYKVYHCGKSVVYHVGGGTLAYSNPQKTYLNFRNSLLVLLKNLPTQSLIWKLPIRWFIDYVAVIKFIFSGNIKDALMIFKAHIYIWKNLIKTLKKRSEISKSEDKIIGIYPKLLLFSYHIARVRKFDDLNF